METAYKFVLCEWGKIECFQVISPVVWMLKRTHYEAEEHTYSISHDRAIKWLKCDISCTSTFKLLRI